MGKKKVKLEAGTLSALLKEAQEQYDYYEEQFEEYDNIEDMHALESWELVVDWLQDKLKDASS